MINVLLALDEFTTSLIAGLAGLAFAIVILVVFVIKKGRNE